MKTSKSEGKHGIQWTSRMQLDDLDFADDLALLSQTQQQMQEKTNSVAAASAAVGLNIHKGKSKVLRCNTACTDPITIDGEDLEEVKTSTYLGSIIDEQSGSDADVKARIGKARAAYLQLKNIWNSKQLSTNTKEFESTGTKNGETASAESVEVDVLCFPRHRSGQIEESSFRCTDKPKLPSDDQENKENDGITSTPISDDEASESHKLSIAKKPSVIKTVPDFSKIHAKAASKLESLVSYASRHNLTNKPRPPFASPPFVNNNKKVSNSSGDKSEISQTNIPEHKFSLQKKTSIRLNDKITILKNSNSVKRSKSLLSPFSSNEISTTVNNQQQANNLAGIL
ncbi:unnamed protein product [Schistosoma margrebowiei]|uniref:Uncharacterized protein n=1 Tax=Schistosoma margrebowiei TaxID=48269 RepID=A0A183LFP3_9TREM|nr:unnamed protein product [Schistosoma margrebowiei]